MNIKTFLAMLARDAHVARRNALTLAFQILLQPMLIVFVFGRVLTVSGLMSMQYKALLLPGIIALSMIMCGTWAVTMPLISEFQFTKEIEDRLLAPMDLHWLATSFGVVGPATQLYRRYQLAGFAQWDVEQLGQFRRTSLVQNSLFAVFVQHALRHS